MTTQKHKLKLPPLSSIRFAILSITVLCVFLQLVNTIPGINLNGLGIYPRNISGLSGLVFAPFLHGSWAHLLSNLIPFAVLSWLVCQYGVKRFWGVFLFTALAGGLSGMAIWSHEYPHWFERCGIWVMGLFNKLRHYSSLIKSHCDKHNSNCTLQWTYLGRAT